VLRCRRGVPPRVSRLAFAAASAGLPTSLVYAWSVRSTTSRASLSSGTSALEPGKGCTRPKSPILRKSARKRRSNSCTTLSGSRLSCSARSSANLVTVG
jgi:hypothetical protein